MRKQKRRNKQHIDETNHTFKHIHKSMAVQCTYRSADNDREAALDWLASRCVHAGDQRRRKRQRPDVGRLQRRRDLQV